MLDNGQLRGIPELAEKKENVEQNPKLNSFEIWLIQMKYCLGRCLRNGKDLQYNRRNYDSYCNYF